jgi:integrase
VKIANRNDPVQMSASIHAAPRIPEIKIHLFMSIDFFFSSRFRYMRFNHCRNVSGTSITLATRLYDLRHTFLTRLGEVNTDPFTIQRIAGHSSITMTQRYVHPTPERLEDAFARLEIYNLTKLTNPPDPASLTAAS